MKFGFYGKKVLKMELFIGLAFLFFASLSAWIKGDDSMSWYVILCVVIVIIGMVCGSCSA